MEWDEAVADLQPEVEALTCEQHPEEGYEDFCASPQKLRAEDDKYRDFIDPFLKATQDTERLFTIRGKIATYIASH